jgi:hypothetical protein
MAQETKVEETGCSLQTFERNRYFYGKPMTVTAFETEQRYLIGKHRYINRLIHGAGILCGLQATVSASFDDARPTIELTEGAALDCCGNLIVVSRSGKAEIKDGFNENGVNYLYIKYTECAKQPIMSAANVASCEEVCCYNRIQETFEVVASASPPVRQSTAPSGVAGTPSSVAAQTSAVSTKGDATSRSVETVAANFDAASLCRARTENYFAAHLRTCPDCDDPKVFLAVLDMKTGTPVIDAAETIKYRALVYNNPMLHELLCEHVDDFNNPHRTTAAQLKALQSVNGVGNAVDRLPVGNITLKSADETIGIDSQVNASNIDLKLAANKVKISHLNEDVIKNLLQSSKTVIVEPNVVGKKISLHTNPATTVTSVGRAKVIGASSNYAPEDHAHDLSDGVVTGVKISDGVVTGAKLAPGAVERTHLSEDVYGHLIVGGGIISVNPNVAGRKIEITASTSPAEDIANVSSIGREKRVGRSGKFAREDHAHDLRINGRSPDKNGHFVLNSGANVTIENGDENELIISASVGRETVIATGFFTFEHVLPQEQHTSDAIPHGLETELVAVVMALEDFDGARSNLARFGDIAAFDEEAPFLMATLSYPQRAIQISLKDRRLLQRGGATTALVEPSGKTETTFELREFELREAVAVTPIQPGEKVEASSQPIETTTPRQPIDVVATPIKPVVAAPAERTYKVRWWAIPENRDTRPALPPKLPPKPQESVPPSAGVEI